MHHPAACFRFRRHIGAPGFRAFQQFSGFLFEHIAVNDHKLFMVKVFIDVNLLLL